MTVLFQHGPAHMPHQRQHGALRNTRLGHFGSYGLPEIVETALDGRALPEGIPGACNVTYRPLRIEWPLRTASRPSGAPREDIPLRLDFPHLPAIPARVLGENRSEIGIDRNLT